MISSLTFYWYLQKCFSCQIIVPSPPWRLCRNLQIQIILKFHIESTQDREGGDGWWRKFQRGTSLRVIPYAYNPCRSSCERCGLLTGHPKIPNSGSSGTTHLPPPHPYDTVSQGGGFSLFLRIVFHSPITTPYSQGLPQFLFYNKTRGFSSVLPNKITS
jgi:hypothetical protein